MLTENMNRRLAPGDQVFGLAASAGREKRAHTAHTPLAAVCFYRVGPTFTGT